MRLTNARFIREAISRLTPGQRLTLASQANERVAEIKAELKAMPSKPKTAKPFHLKPVKPTEAQVQDAILRYLAVERRVVWSARMNSGKGKLLRPDGSQTWIRFGFAGCPDIMGQLTDGRYLAIECKRAGGRVRPEQRAHISLATAHGAVAMIARSVDEVQAALDAALSRPTQSGATLMSTAGANAATGRAAGLRCFDDCCAVRMDCPLYQRRHEPVYGLCAMTWRHGWECTGERCAVARGEAGGMQADQTGDGEQPEVVTC